MKTFECQIWKIDQNKERNNDDAFLSATFDNSTEAGEWLYNNKNHPCIDCAGFEIVVNDEVMNTYMYGVEGWEYPIDAEDKAIETE